MKVLEKVGIPGVFALMVKDVGKMKGNIGRGKNMSLAKAALKYYYEVLLLEWGFESLDYGLLSVMHDIIDIAGAKQTSLFAPSQVTNCLAKSPYWKKSFIPRFYNGMRGHGGANIFTPSEKGKEYYEKYIRGSE